MLNVSKPSVCPTDTTQILEMYNHKSGYGPGEQFTAHARHRYRLLPPRMPTGGPQVDSSLWITHYCAAEPSDRVPSTYIPMNDPRVQQMVSTRSYLQQQGAIMHKEFMLRDSAHWPQIQWPHNNQGSVRGPGYGGPVRTPQSVAYPTHVPASGPPAKRARTNANAGQAPLGGAAPADMLDDEEETSRGDVFDHMTPREISLNRYKQNHRWLEEIINSPYSINQITPVDLGLGLKGPLASLTEGIFYAPSGDPDSDNHLYDYVGQLDEGKADEFRKRVNERIEADNAEMERMKRKHAKRLAKMKNGAAVILAEKALRTAAHDPSDVGQEYWRLEGRVDEDENGEKSMPTASGKVDDIVAQVEASLGRHAAAVQELLRIQDGGLEETVLIPKVPTPNEISRNDSQQSGVMINNDDTDMGESSAAGLLDQFHTGFSSTSTPAANFPTPGAMLQADSSVGNTNVPSPTQTGQPTTASGIASHEESDAMQGMENNASSHAEGNKDDETVGDWVVVPKGGEFLPSRNTSGSSASGVALGPIEQSTQGVSDSANQDFGLDIPDDFNDLDDLDTAGEALSGFGNGGDNGTGGGLEGELHGSLGDDLGGDIDFGMGNDDIEMGDHDGAMGSFDDAFAGVEPRDDDGGHGNEEP